jgi:hypothetical protein
MKKLIVATGLVLFIAVTKAQPPQPPMPPSIEERLKRTNEVLQSDVKPTVTQKTTIESVFKTFFIAADKLGKENPPPPPDPKVKEVMNKLVKERDESVKKILTTSQYEKYKEAAKKLHPPKPGEQNGKDGHPPPPHQ